MLKAIIFSGGDIDIETAKKCMRSNAYDIVIASDKGLEMVDILGVHPNLIVGDFDSVDADIIKKYEDNPVFTGSVKRFIPEKDATDTELAVQMAIEMGAEKIDILGATGNRIDHILGAIAILYKALKQGVSASIIDNNNRIRIIDDATVIKKSEQYGKYVSIFPYGTDVGGVTLKGLKYPLNDYTLKHDTSIGVSNEIVDDEAVIEIRGGAIVIVESDVKG